MSDLVISLIRTFVPVLVGGAVAWLVRQGLIPADSGVAQPLTEVLTVLFTGGYYFLVRLIEHAFPAAGWLLGHPAKPSYSKAA